VVAASKQLNINLPYLSATVLNERLLNILFIALIAFVLTFYLEVLHPFKMVIFLFLVVALGCVIWVLVKKQNNQPSLLKDEQSQSKPKIYWQRFLQGVAILKSPPVLIGTLVSSLISWLGVWLGVYFLARNVYPEQPLVCALALVLFMNVVSLVHLTPSNVGPFQWGCILAFSYFGVGRAEAVGFSLVLQGIRVVAASFVGIYAAVHTFILPRFRLQSSAEEEFRSAKL
jgi:uncharacterized protein (TIRG00374 family)